MNYEISPAFTIDDIHKIREKNGERQKTMTSRERIADTARQGREIMLQFGFIDPATPAVKNT
jgi:hypothetical protein